MKIRRNLVILALIALIGTFIILSCNSTNELESQSAYIELRGVPTTGYSWTYNNSDNYVVKVTDEIIYMDARESGAPSLYTYTITSLQPGTSILTFEYSNLWDEDLTQETRTYEVTVTKTGKVKLHRIYA